MKKRVISWLLTVVMVVSLLPTSVLADTLAADQEQQTQQEQITPVDTENTVPAEDEETQEQQEPAEEVPVSQMAAAAARRWRWRKELSAPRRSLRRWTPAAAIR